MKISPKGSSACVVCGDRALGKNYGVLTCEGCKKFFRITSLQKTKLVCLKKFTCKITKETRRQCRYCRFQACLHAGMIFPKRDDLDEDAPPKRKKNKLSSGMDLINILLEAQGSSHITNIDDNCKRTRSSLQDTDEMGENGRSWASRFVSRILESCGDLPERTCVDQEKAVLDIMTMRLAASFVPELKGFLFQSGSLVSLSDIAKCLRRNLCRRLFYMSSLLICMGVDDREVSLLCGILATLPRPSQDGRSPSPLLDDLLRSHITTLHQYELNKRSFRSNMSYKMLQALLNVHEISSKEDSGLFVWDRSQESEVIQKRKGLPPSPETANILAMELLQGLVSCQSSTPSETVQRSISSPDLGGYLNSSAFVEPYLGGNFSDVFYGSGFSNGRKDDKHFGVFNHSFQTDLFTLPLNNVPSSYNNNSSHQQTDFISDLPTVSYNNDLSSLCYSAENFSTQRCMPPSMQYYPPSDIFGAIYSSCKQQLSQLGQHHLQSYDSDVQYLGTLHNNTKNKAKNHLDLELSYTSFMIGQHPAFIPDT